MNGAIFTLALKSIGNRIYTVGLTVLAIAMSVTLFSLNFLGDGLRDAFDPAAVGALVLVPRRVKFDWDNKASVHKLASELQRK